MDLGKVLQVLGGSECVYWICLIFFIWKEVDGLKTSCIDEKPYKSLDSGPPDL